MYLPLFQEKIDDTTDQRALIIILDGGFHCAYISCNLVRQYKAYSHLSRVPYSFVATDPFIADFSDIPIMCYCYYGKRYCTAPSQILIPSKIFDKILVAYL